MRARGTVLLWDRNGAEPGPGPGPGPNAKQSELETGNTHTDTHTRRVSVQYISHQPTDVGGCSSCAMPRDARRNALSSTWTPVPYSCSV